MLEFYTLLILCTLAFGFVIGFNDQFGEYIKRLPADRFLGCW